MSEEIIGASQGTPEGTETQANLDTTNVNTTSTENQVTPQLYSLKVNGEEKQLPLEEVLKLAQMGDDYTRKTQTLAQERKQVEAIQAKAMELQKYGWDIDSVIGELSRQAIEAEATKNNIDPKFYQEFVGLKEKLSSYETERQSLQHEKELIEQDKTLSTDPHVGELYKKYKSEVHELAKSTNSDYDVALTILLRNKIPELLNSTKTSAEQDAVKKLIGNSTSSPGSLSQGAESQGSSISTMSKSDFAKLQEQVLRGERKNI